MNEPLSLCLSLALLELLFQIEHNEKNVITSQKQNEEEVVKKKTSCSVNWIRHVM